MTEPSEKINDVENQLFEEEEKSPQLVDLINDETNRYLETIARMTIDYCDKEEYPLSDAIQIIEEKLISENNYCASLNFIIDRLFVILKSGK